MTSECEDGPEYQFTCDDCAGDVRFVATEVKIFEDPWWDVLRFFWPIKYLYIVCPNCKHHLLVRERDVGKACYSCLCKKFGIKIK